MKKDIFGARCACCEAVLLKTIFCSDPYAVILVQNNAYTTLKRLQTETIKRTLNPIWNEQFLIRVDPSLTKLTIELYDENRIVSVTRSLRQMTNVSFRHAMTSSARSTLIYQQRTFTQSGLGVQ